MLSKLQRQVMLCGCAAGVFFLGQCVCALVGRFNAVLGGLLLSSAGAFFLLALVYFVAALSGVHSRSIRSNPPAEASDANEPLSTWDGRNRLQRFGIVTLNTSITLVALGVFCVRYGKPSERILGGNDEGIYFNSAVNLAKSGCYCVGAPLLPQLSPALRPWVLKQEPAEAQRNAAPSRRYSRYFAGFFVADEKRGVLTPQFPIGFPAVLGSAYSVGGWTAMRGVNLFCVSLSAIILGLLARRWLGPAAATGAFLVFLFFPLHVWAGRTACAEPSAQLLWLIACWSWSERHLHPRLAGSLCGLALASAFLFKIDALPLASLLVGLTVVTWKRERGFALTLGASGAMVASLAAITWRQFNRFYLTGTLSGLMASIQQAWWIAAIFGACGLIVRRLDRRWSLWRDEGRAVVFLKKMLPHIAAGLLLSLALYAYFLRPNPVNFDQFFYWPARSEIRSYREDTFLRLGWYWQPWGLALATLGTALLLFRLRTGWQRAFWCVGFLYLALFCFDLRNNPIQPYAMRRLIPFATPLLALGAAGWGMVFFDGHRRLAKVATCLTTLALMAGFAPLNERVNTRVDYAGLIRQTQLLAATIPADAILLFRDTSAVTAFATPLHCSFGKDCVIVAPMSSSPQYERALTEFMTQRLSAGKRVFLLGANPRDRLDLFYTKAITAAAGRITTSCLMQSATQLNNDFASVEWEYYLSELTLRAVPRY